MQACKALSLFGLAALAAAVPAPAPAPEPVITAAPRMPSEADLVRRQDGCSLEASTVDGQPVSNCACDGTTSFAPRTMINSTPLVFCGTMTGADPLPSEYYAQPQVSAPAAVQYGALNPVEIISAISASCAKGCGGGKTTTTSALLYPTPTSAGATATVTNMAQMVDVEYSISTEALPEDDFPILIEALSTLMSGASTSTTFDWIQYVKSEDGVDPYSGTQTQYMGPAIVNFQRYTQDNTGKYTNVAGLFEMSVTSVLEGADGLTCDAIVGPIGSALGLIPEIGGVLGFIGSGICNALGE